MSIRNIIYIASGVLVAAGVVALVMALRRPEVPDISGKLHLIKDETVCLRFKVIYGQSSDMLLAGKFFDLDGNVVGRFEKPYSNDGPIGVQFADVDLKGRHVIFPQTLIIGDKEITLPEYYASNGFPQVYNSILLDSTLRAGIGCMFGMLMEGNENGVSDCYGNVSTITNQTDLPSEGSSYEWHVTSGGKVYFLKN